MTKLNTLLATTAVLALAACGSSSTPKVEKPTGTGMEQEYIQDGEDEVEKPTELGMEHAHMEG